MGIGERVTVTISMAQYCANVNFSGSSGATCPWKTAQKSNILASVPDIYRLARECYLQACVWQQNTWSPPPPRCIVICLGRERALKSPRAPFRVLSFHSFTSDSRKGGWGKCENGNSQIFTSSAPHHSFEIFSECGGWAGIEGVENNFRNDDLFAVTRLECAPRGGIIRSHYMHEPLIFWAFSCILFHRFPFA